MSAQFLAEEKLSDFLLGLDGAGVFAQTRDDAGSDFERLERGDAAQLALREPRAPGSLKTFLFPTKERVAVYPSEGYDWAAGAGVAETTVVAGVRACDIEAMKILDSVFVQEDWVDPFYQARREATTVVAVDCVEPSAACFCTLVGGKPYVEEGADVVLTPIADGYVADALTDKGKEMMVASVGLLREATEAEMTARQEARSAAADRLAEINAAFGPPNAFAQPVDVDLDSDHWRERAGECVECGSCTAICPTCHCFQLYDQASDSEEGPFERMKTWDSCILSSYSKMAGAGGMKASPRPELRHRFANRLVHKFTWFPANMGRLACVGCGRCIEACLGKRDLRELLGELAMEEVS